MASTKPSNTRSVSALLLPPSPSPLGSFDTPLSHLSTSLPPRQLPTPKILGQCMANRGQRSTGEPEKDRAGGGMLWVEHVCIHPMGGLQAAALLYLLLGSMCVGMCVFLEYIKYCIALSACFNVSEVCFSGLSRVRFPFT